MSAPLTCACGAAIQQPRTGRRRSMCERCRGQAVRAQENARSKRMAHGWSGRINWHLVGHAVQAVVTLQGLRRPAVAKRLRLSPEKLDALIDGAPVSREIFRRVCKWLGWPPARFRRIVPGQEHAHARAAIEAHAAMHGGRG